MGNIRDLASMIPGMDKALKGEEIDDDAFKSIKALIRSAISIKLTLTFSVNLTASMPEAKRVLETIPKIYVKFTLAQAAAR